MRALPALTDQWMWIGAEQSSPALAYLTEAEKKEQEPVFAFLIGSPLNEWFAVGDS